MTPLSFALVAVGGAIGSVLRFSVATFAPRVFGQAFPYGTLIVNVLGCFMIVVVMTIALQTTLIGTSFRIFLTTGVMGGFTTYSSFNYETLALANERQWVTAAMNLGFTVVTCLLAGILGQIVGRMLVPR